MQRQKVNQNGPQDVKDNATTTQDTSTDLILAQALDCSEAAEDKDIQALIAIMKPLVEQLNKEQEELDGQLYQLEEELASQQVQETEEEPVPAAPQRAERYKQVNRSRPAQNAEAPDVKDVPPQEEKAKIELNKAKIAAQVAKIAAKKAELEIKKAALEEKNQIPNYMKEYFTNPAFLEEYARDEIRGLLQLGRLPNNLIYDYLGYTPEHIASLLTSEPAKRNETIGILRRLRNRLLVQAEADREKANTKMDGMLMDLLFTDIEHPELAIMDTLSKMTPTQKARAITVRDQYWKAGYFAIHQPEATLYKIVESHFNNYEIKPEAATCVFSGLVPLSSNAVPANPLCWMFDVITQISPGMHSKVVTYVKDGANMKVMTSLGIDHTEYQKFFGKMSTPKLVETKDTVKFDATKGAEATHVGAAHVVSKSASEAMLDGIFKFLPTPEPVLVPEDHVIIFVSFQTDAWFDYIIRGNNGDYAAYNAKAIKNKKGEFVVLHSGDFLTPEGIDDNVLDIYKEERARPRQGGSGADNNQIVLYIPQKPGREPSHHHFAAAAFAATFDEKIRQSCYAFAVKPTQKELDDLQTYLVTGNTLESSKLVKKLTNGVKPLFSLRSTKPYADAKASGVQPLSVQYDGQRTYVNIWGLPLNFAIMASQHQTTEWGKLIQDLDRVVALDHNKAQRQVLLNREKKAEKKADKNKVSVLCIEDLADKHDQLRDVTAQLITHKIESKDQEVFLFNPAQLCYQKIRTQVMDKITPQLIGCYVKADLEAEMKQREKDRVAEVKRTYDARKQAIPSQVYKEVALRQQIDPSLKVLDVTRQLLAKKEAELNQLMVEQKDLDLNDFYQAKFKLDMLTSKMDPTQCHRVKTHESLKKLAQDKMAELKDIMHDLLNERDEQFNQAVNQIQANLNQGVNAFCDLEAKDREERAAKEKADAMAKQAAKKKETEAKKAEAAKGNNAAVERKETAADKAARLAKEKSAESERAAKEAALDAEKATAEKAAHLASRKQLLAEHLHQGIEAMTSLIMDKIEQFGDPFTDLVSKQEIEERLMGYLWSMVEAKLQARNCAALNEFFKGKLPLNNTDITIESIDAKTELCRLAEVENPIVFDCMTKQQELNELHKNPDVVAKIGKLTAFAFSIFKKEGEEVSAEAVVNDGNARPRYLQRIRRPGHNTDEN